MPNERRQDPPRDPARQGQLLLIGGSEGKTGRMEVLRTLVEKAGGAHARIEVITTASSEPEKVWETYEAAFAEIGVGYCQPLHIQTRGDADDGALVGRIGQASAVLFTGGDQLRITSILDATRVMSAIREFHFEGGRLIAGTSAGAAALTGTIIYDGASPEALHKGSVKMTGGLGLISGAIVDTHFFARGRFGRLVEVVTGSPRLVGVGIGEDTAVLITGGTDLTVVGSGLVMIVDGAHIGYTNVFDVQHMEPFSVENVRVHVLSSGAGYDLDARAFRPPPPRGATPEGVLKATAEATAEAKPEEGGER